MHIVLLLFKDSLELPEGGMFSLVQFSQQCQLKVHSRDATRGSHCLLLPPRESPGILSPLSTIRIAHLPVYTLEFYRYFRGIQKLGVGYFRV